MHHATRLFPTQGGKCFPTFPGNGRNDNKFNLFYFSSLVFLKDSSGEKAKLQKCTQRRNNWFHIAYHEVLIALELQWHDMYFWLVCTTFHQWVYSRWIQFYFFFVYICYLRASTIHPQPLKYTFGAWGWWGSKGGGGDCGQHWNLCPRDGSSDTILVIERELIFVFVVCLPRDRHLSLNNYFPIKSTRVVSWVGRTNWDKCQCLLFGVPLWTRGKYWPKPVSSEWSLLEIELRFEVLE